MENSNDASSRKASRTMQDGVSDAKEEMNQGRSSRDDLLVAGKSVLLASSLVDIDQARTKTRENVQDQMLARKEKAIYFPESITNNQVESSSAILDADERDHVVLDVSPSGHCISSLDSYIEKGFEISHVKDLYIYDNIFTILPNSISKLNNLKTLKIFSNEVRLLPDDVGDIGQLEHLQMKVCTSGIGNLPPLGQLNSLKTLELHQTPFRPQVFSFPSEISKLQLLTRLAICNFSISFLPPEIGCLKNLEELDISFNKLKALPNEISKLVSLKHLRAENNKLIELPSGLSFLPDLSSIDVAHNKLSSLESLQLGSMASLRVLNAKFNKLRSTCDIPDWIACSFDGNPVSQESSSNNDEIDYDLPLSRREGDDVSSNPMPVPFHSKKGSSLKNPVHDRKKRLWKRQGTQQLQARQDRLNLSRKTKVDIGNVFRDGTDCTSSSRETAQAERVEKSSLTVLSVDSKMGTLSGDVDLRFSERLETEDSVSKEFESTQEADANNLSDCPKRGRIANMAVSSDKNVILENTELGDNMLKEAIGEFGSETERGFLSVFMHNRRKDCSTDLNPKPMKRRRSIQVFSQASYAYKAQSFIGFEETLQDGFYDAGREHPFYALEVLENQQECLEAREVILVDREQDEELDVIVLSAQNFLSKLDLAGKYDQDGYCTLNEFQRAVMLSLFVSDCFGGSDKTLDVSHARRGVLGGRPGIPFLCSCNSGSRAVNKSEGRNCFDRSNVNIPTVHMLCEESIKSLKMQRQSNIIPIGLLPYGVCRHRAILFKYLCDRTSILCELVRGYLDYQPHAWNVIEVNKGNTRVRMLVDACRPLDIREESDLEYFCRYIPFRRFRLPLEEGGKLEVVQSEKFRPVLLEDIGSGASGSVVRKCSLGTFTLAAKVHTVKHGKEMRYKDVIGRFLSELRTLCSLGDHPHVVSYYGHELTWVQSDCGKNFQLTLLMDLVQGCSLQVLLSRYSKDGRKYMPLKEAAYVSKSILDAMSHIHSKGIVHRDIKSSNILVNLKRNQEELMPIVKLCDFDSAVPLASSAAHSCYLAHHGIPSVEVCVGTPRWMAPEVLQAIYSQKAYGLEADVWSFGCMLFEMLTLQVPYAGIPEAEIQSYIEMGHRPQLPSIIEDLVSEAVSDKDDTKHSQNLPDEELKIMKDLVKLFKACTESCPDLRPTSTEAFSALSKLDVDFNTGFSEIHAEIKACTGQPDKLSSPEENTMGKCPASEEGVSFEKIKK